MLILAKMKIHLTMEDKIAHLEKISYIK